ncbi:MAG: hypothetical protein EHM13_02225 [Acidobacteria bacterium]|nr:MAG: hypothetical protein EHM13_02225 [Acidobacteriota bacterium]
MKQESPLTSTLAFLAARKTPLAIHGAILSAFFAFLLLWSDAVFDILSRMDDKASRQRISLPEETDGMEWSIDRLQVLPGAIEVDGWAFIAGQDARESRVYAVLKSASDTYVFDTFPRIRPDVSHTFSGAAENVDHSGFVTFIPRDAVPGTGLVLGVYVEGKVLSTLQYTDRVIRGQSKQQHVSLPQPDTGVLTYAVDRCSPGDGVTVLEGWGFIEGADARSSRTLVVLQSDADTYVFDTFWRRRLDIGRAYDGHGRNLQASGFVAFIPEGAVPPGD